MAKPTLIERAEPWSDIERLNKERDLLGFYLTASPLDPFALVLRYKCNLSVANLNDLSDYVGKEIIFGGIVTGYREMTTRKNTRAGFIKLQDFDGEGEIALFGEAYPKFSMYGKEGLFLFVKAEAERGYSGDRVFLKINSIQLLDQVADSLINQINIHIPILSVTEEFYNDIVPDLIECEEGNISINIIVSDSKSGTYLNLESPQLSGITISNRFLEKLTTYDEHGITFEVK